MNSNYFTQMFEYTLTGIGNTDVWENFAEIGYIFLYSGRWYLVFVMIRIGNLSVEMGKNVGKTLG